MKIIFIILFFFPISMAAQTTITGKVINKANKPVTANVTVQAKGSSGISGFTATDTQGEYSIVYKGTADSITITINSISAGKHSKTIINKSARVDFNIEEKPIQLKEVKVTPPKITRTGDTLNYMVSSFADQNDRTIGDVIKKLPGIEVSPGGTISYNGKEINRFYIENMDLLQGRYSLATNNVTAKDIATVQIFENHQPIKALRERAFSDHAALNLKLKESAKGTLAITALAGGGYKPLMWNGELITMYFARKLQNMSLFKTNNAGKDVLSELRTHYDYERVLVGFGSQLSIQSPSTPPVAPKRYLYNRTHAFAFNNLVKLDKDLECTVNAVYYNNRLEKEGYSLSELYFPGDSVLSIEEKITTINRVHNADLAVRINSNTDKYYLNNAFNMNGHWDKDKGAGNTLSGNINETILQKLEKPSFSVDNTLDMIKNTKDNSYQIHFSVGYASMPHNLKITPAVFNIENQEIKSLNQEALSKDFSALLRLTYGLKMKDVKADYTLWARTDIKNLNTTLTGETDNGQIVFPSDSLKNHLYYNTHQAGFNQTYIYNKGKFKSTFTLPLIYYLLTIDNKIPDKFTNYSRLVTLPSLSAKYELTHELELSAAVNFKNSYGDMSSAYTGYIMHSYRSLLRNTVDDLFATRQGGGRLGLSYRSAINSLFINANVSYNRSWRNLLYGYNYFGIMRVKTTINQPTEFETYSTRINGSKNFIYMNSTIRLSYGYNEGKGEQLLQDEIIHYKSKSHNIGTELNFSPVSFMSIMYKFSYSQSKSYMEKREERFPSIKSTAQNARVSFFPVKGLTLNISAEHQYNSALSNNNRYTYFADAGIKYKHKQVDVELEFNNIFNTDEYVSASYSDISTYYYSYKLRSASVLLSFRFKLK